MVIGSEFFFSMRVGGGGEEERAKISGVSTFPDLKLTALNCFPVQVNLLHRPAFKVVLGRKWAVTSLEPRS